MCESVFNGRCCSPSVGIEFSHSGSYVIIAACAPRYIWFSLSQPRYDPDESRSTKETTVGNRRDPVGTCWVVDKNFNESQEFSPCRTRYWGYHRQGSCQAGLGAAMAKVN
uniref:Uncharacterized protein n=1 Tax=Vespula pensylvanica TaxID=30213 RepID=A0A834NWN6_VESPE|nr:hypothetical protein H0235_010143 [Vespula pensylvanica]